MISVVIPTRNRAKSLVRVLKSYYCQKKVTEMIIVDDASNDSTQEDVYRWSAEYSDVPTEYMKLAERHGATAARHTGTQKAINPYILFGEDDVYLEENYTETLLNIFSGSRDVGVVSGRIIYMEKQETPEESLARFGNGIMSGKPFNPLTLTWNPDVAFQGDVEIPFTHSVYLTRKEFVQRYAVDPHYNKGNGFREESDFQAQVFLDSCKVIMTNRTHCFHISRREIPSGGQRMGQLRRFYWEFYHTRYFYKKFFAQLKPRLTIPISQRTALFLFCIDSVHRLFIKPLLRLPRRLLERSL